MLWQRVATAVVLLAVLLPTIFLLPPLYWGLLTLVFLTVAGSEWRTLQSGDGDGDGGSRSSGVGLGLALLLAGLGWLWLLHGAGAQPAVSPSTLSLYGTVILAVSVLYWLVAAPLQLRQHQVWRAGPVAVFVLLFACWLALYELRLLGVVALVAAMCIVWIADIGAYFVGRGFGRRKLAPSISPGKSWEGAIGGAFFVVVIGLIAAAAPGAESTLPTRLIASWGPLIGIVMLTALSALSVVGDLHESMLKRQAGVKDSGRSLPGHGGVLDRIDALVSTMPAIALLHRMLP